MVQGRLFDLPERSAGEAATAEPGSFASLAEARAAALTCTRCGLAATRQRVVFGEGAGEARLMIVGEGPSEADDSGGHPYSGPSGRLLDRWLAELGLDRASVWITNVVRCRPAAWEAGRLVNRPPSAAEAAACRPWLLQEIALVRPAVILGLGSSAGRALVGKSFALNRQRGQWLDGPDGRPTLISFQPAYLLRLEEPLLSQVQATVAADLAAVAARLASGQ